MTTPLFLPENVQLNAQQQALIQRYQLTISTVPCEPFQLIWEDNCLKLMQTEIAQQGAIFVDFCGPQSEYRRNQVSIKNEVIGRAVGIKPNVRPSVLDATAGLGRDGFVLAALGCQVTYLERNPTVCALLDDGLSRAYQDEQIGAWAKQRLKLIHGSAHQMLELVSPAPDVIYLDPMFPHKKKSALVKKEMKAFQGLVGADLDADALLSSALKLATQRVVVKRPNYAEPLNGQKPQFTIDSKKHRFDIYLTN